MTMAKVLVTGAAGRIGSAVCPVLAERWDVVPTDLHGHVLDVTDLDGCRAACIGMDAVVHLAGIPDPNATWDVLLPANVIGTYTIAQAAADAGVRRLVLASSAQAVAGYPPGRQLRAEDRVRPANLYGATKAWAEAIGSWVASSSATTVVVLRIGYCSPDPPRGQAATPRNLAAWLSYGDAARLISAAIDAAGIRYFVANGVSANRHLHLELTSTMEALSYLPVDDAWAGDERSTARQERLEFTAVTESQKLEQTWETPSLEQIPVISRAHIEALEATDDDATWIPYGQVLVLVHTIGRKSGKEHKVPLPVWRDAGGHRIVVASFAGAPNHPSWFLNLRDRKDPEVLVRVQDGRYWSVPEILEGDDYDLVWAQLTADRAWYTDYQAKTERRIPLVRLPETRPA